MFINFTPKEVISATRKLKSAVGVTVHQKKRNYWGLAYKAEGVTYYYQDGRKIRSDRSHVILLPKGGRYAWQCEEPGECILIDFDAGETGNTIQSIEIGDGSEFITSFAKMERSLNSDNPLRHLESMQCLYGILLLMARAANKKYAPKDQYDRLNPAMDYMLGHYSDPRITNDLLAGLCGMSVVYFRKCFESAYGTSPIRYLHRLRMEKAKGMLLSDYDSIGQIAESVGYGSIYHFSKMFRSYVGISPTAFAATGGKK